MEDTVELLLEVLEGKWRNPSELEGLEKSQTPQFVAVLCSDSRNQTNDIYQEPRNSVFHPSTIGNHVLGIVGSNAYPIEHLESVRLALVVGHVKCGAVKHAYEMAEHMKPVVSGGNIQEVVSNMVDYFIKTGASRKILPTNGKDAIDEELLPIAQLFASAKQFLQEDEEPYLVRHAVANVYMQAAALLRLDKVKGKVEACELVVAGLLYDFAGKLGKKGNTYLVSYNGDNTGQGLKAAQIAAAINPNLILPQQKVFMMH